MVMQAFEALISDADGTLVNTVPLIRHGQYETAVTFLRHHGVPAGDIPQYDQYEKLLNQVVGGSARQTLERTVRALYEDRTHHLEGMDYDELHALLDPIQDRLAPEYIQPFPHLADTLAKIGRMGIKLGIFTSGTPHHIVRNFGIALKDRVGSYSSLYQDRSIDDPTKLNMFTERLEEVFNIPKLTVVTCDDVQERTKPDPLSALIALERLGVRPENAAVMGDHTYDIQSGASAGIAEGIGITHGFEDESVLRKAGATHIITSLSELPAILARR